jgi:hypothetical protein
MTIEMEDHSREATNDLTALAEAKFGKGSLSDAENLVLKNVTSGKWAKCGPKHDDTPRCSAFLLGGRPFTAARSGNAALGKSSGNLAKGRYTFATEGFNHWQQVSSTLAGLRGAH